MKKTFFSLAVAILLSGLPGILLAASSGGGSATANAQLTQVSGTVTLKSKSGKSRKAQTGAKAYEGEKVKVAKGGKATLTFFDGSALELQSNTQIVIAKLKKSSEKEKNLKFKLTFGALVAKVKKLLTPTSSFEVEAGGAICGVRGTQYNMSYDPATNKTTITVTEGSVYFNIGGNTYIVHAGESISFTNGHPDKGTGQNQQGPKTSDSNDNGQGSLGSIGNVPPGDGGALDDLNNQFVTGIITNGDNTNTAVGGVKVNVSAGIPAGEAVP